MSVRGRPRRLRHRGFAILPGVLLAVAAAQAAEPLVDAIEDMPPQADVSFLNQAERPAGKRGFVHAKGDALVFEDGTPARFWGINVTAAALFQSDPASIKAHAHRLSSLGFNLVRLHHHDSAWSRPNIFGPRSTLGTRTLDPAMVEKIDWWIKCLKDEGIYVWLDLHVGRELHRTDGIADFAEIAKGKDSVDLKGFNYVNDDIEKAMKAFNEAYLGHVNPYTGLAYKNDPAVAAMMITNENDLTHHYGNALVPNQKVPKHSARYMQEAHAFARRHGLPQDKVWRAWEPGPSKIFLNDLERRFNERMIAHLRSLGVKVPIVTTSLWGVQRSSLPALTAGDMIDVHAYEEPGFIERDPRVGGNSVHAIAAAHLGGMPISVTEWNSAKFPDADRAGLVLYMAASASHQRWDALMHYAYAQKPLNLPAAASNWHAFNDPARLAMFPAAALIYRQGQVQAATQQYTWSPSKSQLFDAVADPRRERALRIAAETGRLTTSLPVVSELPWLRSTAGGPAATRIEELMVEASGPAVTEVVSAHGELRRNWSLGYFSIDTPRTQAAAGSMAGRSLALSDITLRMNTSHVSVAVQSLDREPIAKSGDILVSIAAPSTPDGTRLPFMTQGAEGEIEIRAMAGLKSPAQPGVQVRPETGRYLLRLDGNAPVHWIRLQRHARAAR